MNRATTFGDLILEFGEPVACELPHRGLEWQIEQSGNGWRMQVSRPSKDVGFLTRANACDWESWIAGEIYSYDGTPGETGDCVVRFLTDLCQGNARPESLSGRFLVLARSAKSRTWNIWTDRAGCIHAYVAGREGRRALGTFSPAVYMYSRRQLDWIGLNGFFSFGFFPQDRTYYDDCRILRASSRYEFSDAGQMIRRTEYWRWSHRPDERRNEADTIAEFGDTLSRAIRRQTSGRVALPLSGGLDSRTVAACLPPDRRPLSYSYGYTQDSVEQRIAGEVAKAAGLEFNAHTISPYLFDYLPTVLDSVEGFQDVTQTRQANIVGWLDKHADHVLAAHWGDVLCDAMGLEHSRISSGDVLDHLEGKMIKRGRDWLIASLCAPELKGEAPNEVARWCLKAELDNFGHIEDADFQVKAVKTVQWAFRWTLPSIRMYQPAAVPRLPFLDAAMMDFFCTVPTWMVRGRRLQIEYLKRFAPRLARIRWQAYDANLFHYQNFNTWQVPRRAWQKLMRAVRARPTISRNWEVQFRSPGQFRNLENLLVRRESLLLDLVPREKVQSLLNEFRNAPSAGNGYTISMLATFSAWADRFHRGRQS